MSDNEIPTETLAETEHYSLWVSQEPDGEDVYHLDMGQVTMHFFYEEWEEFMSLLNKVRRS